MRLTWATDLHLEFVGEAERDALYRRIAAEQPTGVLISGDIANGQLVCRCLADMVRAVTCPVYFVLGNHDYYGRSVREFRQTVAEFAAATPRLTYLTTAGVVELSQQTALVGHDGWADGRYGDFGGSSVFLNDFTRIEEFAYRVGAARRAMLEQLADEGAAHLSRWLPQAAGRYRDVLVLTHVPPFPDASRYDGRPSDPQWLPFFASKVMGDLLSDVAGRFEKCRLTVLCGHSHGDADIHVRPNLRVLAGAAEYRSPAVQCTFTEFG